jgi:hypothetical protein
MTKTVLEIVTLHPIIEGLLQYVPIYDINR